ncbi:hypothetical protein MFIFM68171_08025 [Madurella fahalii]|uniref:Uncharacterized protein n=1 Tax=Madurella fahalii TaxID=1157608 RepID=A0ABQ0GJD2_9PEZI
MATSAEFQLPAIPPLRGAADYQDWYYGVVFHLNWFQVREFVEGTAAVPGADATIEEQQAYRRNKMMAYSILRNSVNPVMDIIKITGYDDHTFQYDAKLLLDVIKKAILDVPEAGRNKLENELFEIPYCFDVEDLRAYVNRFDWLVWRLGGLGVVYNDKKLQSLFLDGLINADLRSELMASLEAHMKAGTLTYKGMSQLVMQEVVHVEFECNLVNQIK